MTVITTEKEPLKNLLNKDLNEMVASLATTFYNMYGKSDRGSLIDRHDLESEGFLASAIAYDSFDPTLGKFSTWAFPYIKNAMTNFCLKFRHPLSISANAARTDITALMDIGVLHLNWPDEDGHDFDIPVASGVDQASETIEFFFKGFSDFEQELLKEHLLDDYSLQEIAFKHGMSKSHVRVLIKRLQARMKARAVDYVKND